MKRYQWVWWGWDWGFGFWRPDADSCWRFIYRWAVRVGPVELRRWEKGTK